MFFGRNEESGLRCVYHGLKFDVDGAIGTLAAYASFGEALAKRVGDRRFLTDGDMFPLTFGGRVIAGATMLLGLVLFGILLNIVGKTIMVLLFGESLTDESSTPATREAILKMMVQRQWIDERRAFEIELMAEEDIKQRFGKL